MFNVLRVRACVRVIIIACVCACVCEGGGPMQSRIFRIFTTDAVAVIVVVVANPRSG